MQAGYACNCRLAFDRAWFLTRNAAPTTINLTFCKLFYKTVSPGQTMHPLTLPPDDAATRKGAIVRLLLEQPLSLADLQTRAAVSMPTLRRDVQELLAGGWIRRIGRSATGGRPATLYGIDGDTHLVIGVHLELPAMNMAAVALDGSIVGEVRRSDNTRLSPDTAVGRMTAFVREMQQAYPERRILGVGIATPGFLDPNSGAVLSIGRFDGWQQFPLRARLRASLGLPALVENDIDCMAFAELSPGGQGAGAASDVLYLGFSEGVKAAMLLDGRLYRGPFGNAGVIGRTLVPDPHDGSPRHLEELVSTGRVGAVFMQRLASGEVDSDERLEAIAGIAEHGARFQAIMDAAAAGEPLSRSVILEALDVLSIAAANLIHILQPGLLILGGALGGLPGVLRPEFERMLRRRLSPLLSHHLLVRYGRLGDAQAAICGAAGRFLHHYPIDQELEVSDRV